MGGGGSCRPRLFVYRLPEAYRDPSASFGHVPADGIGKALRVRGIPTVLWDSEQYSLGGLLHERALAYRCRTHDPSNADLFFVPAYKGRLASDSACAERGVTQMRLLQRLQLPLHHVNGSSSTRGHARSRERDAATVPTSLNARGGADHIMINARNGQPWDKSPYCELTYGAHSFGAALHVAMEAHPHNASWVYPEGYCGKVCVKAYHPQLLSEPLYWSIPWTSTVHLTPSAAAAASSSSPPHGLQAAAQAHAHEQHEPLLPWRSTHVRPTLVAAVLNVKHTPVMPKPTLQLRARLIEACKASPTKCKSANAYGSDQERSERVAALYWNATFCLQPGGDTVTRKGIVDSLLLGCIPVLFHEGQIAQWPWHWRSWVREASVLLNQSAVRHGDVDVIGALSAIPASEVVAMQQALRARAHTMHYSAVDTGSLPAALRAHASPDAFEILLEGAWTVARDSRLQAMGRHLQRTKKGGGELVAYRWQLANAVGRGGSGGGGSSRGSSNSIPIGGSGDAEATAADGPEARVAAAGLTAAQRRSGEGPQQNKTRSRPRARNHNNGSSSGGGGTAPYGQRPARGREHHHKEHGHDARSEARSGAGRVPSNNERGADGDGDASAPSAS